MPTAAIALYGANRVDPIKNPDKARAEDVNFKPSTTIARGTVVGEITASPGVYGPYASGNVDGTQNPVGIAVYDMITDAAGNITIGTGITAGASEWGQTFRGLPIWVVGEFSCADLVGFDANALTKMGRLTQGTVTAGRVMIYGA